MQNIFYSIRLLKRLSRDSGTENNHNNCPNKNFETRYKWSGSTDMKFYPEHGFDHPYAVFNKIASSTIVRNSNLEIKLESIKSKQRSPNFSGAFCMSIWWT